MCKKCCVWKVYRFVHGKNVILSDIPRFCYHIEMQILILFSGTFYHHPRQRPYLMTPFAIGLRMMFAPLWSLMAKEFLEKVCVKFGLFYYFQYNMNSAILYSKNLQQFVARCRTHRTSINYADMVGVGAYRVAESKFHCF